MDDRHGPSLFLLLPLSTSRHKLFHKDLLYLSLGRLWERVRDELLIGGDDYLVYIHCLPSWDCVEVNGVDLIHLDLLIVSDNDVGSKFCSRMMYQCV